MPFPIMRKAAGRSQTGVRAAEIFFALKIKGETAIPAFSMSTARAKS